MHVLITGGGGFIGSHLADALLDKGHDVTVVDSFCSARKANVEHLKEEEDFTLIEEDVLDPFTLDESVDYVMHFASRASPPDYQEHPIHTLKTNSEGTLKMLELAREHGAAFMYASTSEVYGDPEVHPQVEEYHGNVSTTGPRACYDEAKRFGEAAATSFARKHGLDYRIVRIFNTYGPRMRPDDGRVVSSFVTQALRGEPLTVYGDGEQTRSFCYIEDLVEGIVSAMDSESGGLFNLGNPEEYAIKELAEIVVEVTATESEIVHEELPEDDPSRRKPDISKARDELDWEPGIGLRDGLERTASYFREVV